MFWCLLVIHCSHLYFFPITLAYSPQSPGLLLFPKVPPHKILTLLNSVLKTREKFWGVFFLSYNKLYFFHYFLLYGDWNLTVHVPCYIIRYSVPVCRAHMLFYKLTFSWPQSSLSLSKHPRIFIHYKWGTC